MKNKTLLLLAFFALLIATSSCRKEYETTSKPVDSMTDLAVPKSFNWRTTADIFLEINLSPSANYPLRSKISIHTGNPNEGGEKISSGSISLAEPYNAMIRVAAHYKELWLLLETSIGPKEMAVVPISGNQLIYTFGSEKSMFSPSGLKATAVEGPDCADCDYYISGHNTVNIKQGKVYCVTDSFTGNVSFQTWNGGGTLQVCGTAEISSNMSMGTNCRIIVTQGGTLTINSMGMWGANNGIEVYANSTLNITNNLSTTGKFINHGEMNIGGFVTIQQLSDPFVNTGIIQTGRGVNLNNATLENSGTFHAAGVFKLNTNSQVTNDGLITAGDQTELNGSTLINNGEFVVTQSRFNINANSTFTNNGSLDIEAGSFNVNSSAATINNGSVVAASQINFNSGSQVTNNCMMSCAGQAAFNSGLFVFENGYLRSDYQIQINSGANIILKNGSMLSTPRVFLYANINAQGSTNSIVAGEKFTMSSQTVAGAVEVATNDLDILSNTPVSQHFINGATVVGLDDIQNFLPITACNPEGIGDVAIVDTDNDGVPDDLDDFPEDPERAFRSWYPGENTFSTLAFEDLWPGLGDFDFNDAVIEFQYEIITNASNEIVDLIGRFRLMAAGASFDNGFGVSIPVAPSHVASVTGGILQGNTFNLEANGTESGHNDHTVIIVFDAINTIYEGEFINTVPENPYIETDIVTVSVYFSDPVANFGAAPFNPFIVVDQERGKEVHLIDHAPTELVDMQYFGMWEDDSDPEAGSYYKTDANLPWAIEIPVRFDYPIETFDILLTHLKFAEWANSGGTLYQDWYLDQPGYRNDSNIYPIPEEN